MAATREKIFPVRDYDLAATLACGQAFRWREENGAWTGVIHGRWMRLRAEKNSIIAETAVPQSDWRWLADYLQTDIDYTAILASFPDDEPMRAAVRACRGLRLLRQESWECLASFILSSTKQIVQIRQIVELLCERFGEEVCSGGLRPPDNDYRNATVIDRRHNTFPTAARIAGLTEKDLRDCKMGFRAPYLLATAQAVARGEIDLSALRALPVHAAQEELLRLPGVGRKIADCVLLFGLGFDGAFPIDVWVRRALQQLYFPKRRVSARRIERFAATHFGPHAGCAQQYLFHYMRTKKP